MLNENEIVGLAYLFIGLLLLLREYVLYLNETHKKDFILMKRKIQKLIKK